MNPPLFTLDYQIITQDHTAATLAHLAVLPPGQAREVAKTNPAAATALLAVTDKLTAEHTGRDWQVVEIGAMGQEDPFYLTLTANPRGLLEQLLFVADQAGETLDPVTRRVRLASGDIWLRQVGEPLAIKEATNLLNEQLTRLTADGVSVITNRMANPAA